MHKIWSNIHFSIEILILKKFIDKISVLKSLSLTKNCHTINSTSHQIFLILFYLYYKLTTNHNNSHQLLNLFYLYNIFSIFTQKFGFIKRFHTLLTLIATVVNWLELIVYWFFLWPDSVFFTVGFTVQFWSVIGQ